MYINRERVINEIPVCPHTRKEIASFSPSDMSLLRPHASGFGVYIALYEDTNETSHSFIDQVSFTSTLYLPPNSDLFRHLDLQ